MVDFPMVKNTAIRIVFPILDADGDPVTGAAADTPDSEYSLDGAAFSDCNGEITEIAAASGVYYLDLLAAETNGDVVAIQVKTATATTKTTVLVFYTSAQNLDTIDTNVDTLLTRLSAARAGYLDELDFDLDARLGSPAGASISADLLTIDNLVDDVETRLTAARAGYLDNINQAGLLQLTAARAGYLDNLNIGETVPTQTQINTQVDTALTDIDLDHFIQVTAGVEEPTDGSYLDQIMHKAAGQTFDATTDSLEAMRDQGDSAWITAVGFSTHAAADIWAVGARTLTDLTGFSLSAAGIDAIIDEVVEGTLTVRQSLRLLNAMIAGKSSGGGTNTLIYRDYGDAVNRLTFTVDATGNRSAVVKDLT